jgi:hypothetical protein
MLLILLTAAWLSTVLMAVGICRMAAHGDAQEAWFADPHPRSIDEELAHREDPPDLALQDRRKRAAGGGSQPPASDDEGPRAQQDLDVGPQRPVGDVEIVDRHHL